MAARAGIITFTTDFGLSDTYRAQLHAVALRAAPGVRCVDISHAVPPGRMETALFLTETAWPQFPPGTVHVVVVDPGVGTERGLVAVETADAVLVGPDTGVLSSGLPPPMRAAPALGRVPIAGAAGVTAVSITAAAGVAPLSTTFHGRDIMAPVAARIAAGAALADVGTPVGSVMAAPALAAAVREGTGTGRILHIDRFGNAITNLRSADASRTFVLAAGHTKITGPAPHYQMPGDAAVVLGGSAGYLEIAWPNGSAAEHLGLRRGDTVTLRPAEPVEGAR